MYHDREIPQAERLQKVIDDATELLPKCADEYADSEDYQLLERAIGEQTKEDDDGHNIPKGKGDGMDASSLQNPADPDATYRKKAGKEHRGYSANITETVDKNGSVVTDYQYDVNTRSDVDYLRESLEAAETAEETEAWIADGAYASEELAELAADKNIGLLTTGLRGRKPREILTQFKLSEDGHAVTECPEGHTPRSSSYIRQTNSIRVSSFPRTVMLSQNVLKDTRPEAVPTSGRPIPSGFPFSGAAVRTVRIERNATQKSNPARLYSSFLSVRWLIQKRPSDGRMMRP